MRDVRHRLGHERGTLGDERVSLQFTLACHAADTKPVVRSLCDSHESVDPIEINKHRRPRQTKVQQWNEALTAGKRLGVIPELGEQR
jgi:hypothetical protein